MYDWAPPSSLHLSHTIITCQAFTVKSSRTAAAWSSTTKSRRSAVEIPLQPQIQTISHHISGQLKSTFQFAIRLAFTSHIQTAVRLIGSPFSSPFGLQLLVSVLMSPSDNHGLITLLSSPLDHHSAHLSACSLLTVTDRHA